MRSRALFLPINKSVIKLAYSSIGRQQLLSQKHVIKIYVIDRRWKIGE